MGIDNPAVVTEIAFAVHSRTRDSGIEVADKTANEIMSFIGGEPWTMLDDDWQRVHPDQRFTLVDDQGFMYIGKRRYVFGGPLVPSTEVPIRDGWRTQGGDSANSGEDRGF